MSSINASIGTGITYNSDNTATLSLGTGGLTAASIDNGQNITTTNNLTVGKNLSVSGAITLANTVNMTSNVNITSNLAVTGNITLNGAAMPTLTQMLTYTLALG